MKKDKTFKIIYFLGFFFALATALPTYIMSSFIAQYIGVNNVGLFIASTNGLLLLSILFYPKVIRKFNNLRTMIFLLLLTIASLLLLGVSQNIFPILFFFIIQYITLTLLLINLDIALENISTDNYTGRIRTRFLTMMNMAWVISPLIMGQIIDVDNYQRIFLVAGVILLFVLFILYLNKAALADHKIYYNRKFKNIINILKKNKNLLKIFTISLVLRLFYCIMVLYIPIYLHENFGFSWSALGIVFTVMLLPFVLFEMPAGNAADKFWGEKEIMTLGIGIMLMAVTAVFITNTTSIIIWAIILFVSRTGASLVEAMQETYFFKKVDGKDMDIINVFRDLNPAGWLIGAFISYLILQIFNIQIIFLFLSLVLLLALWPALTIKDTK